MAKPEPLTVAALIEALRAHPQDAYVLIEGCDCVGYARSVDEPDDEAKTDKTDTEFEGAQAGRHTVTINRA